MKTLEQLGISPAPWRINDHAYKKEEKGDNGND